MISQLFFDNAFYFDFVERARQVGINVPIVPGIMPVTNFNGAKRMAVMNGASIPEWFENLFDGLEDETEIRKLVSTVAAAEQCARLRAHGVEDFHFYTLNRAELTYALCHILGLRTAAPKGEKTI